MFKNLFSLKLLLPFVAVMFFASCNSEDEFFENDDFLDQMLLEIDGLEADVYTADLVAIDFDEEWETDMQRFRGKRPCFKIVFPVTLIFPDGTTKVVVDRADMRASMHEWKELNPDYAAKPTIDFPFDVKMKDGTTMTIENEEQLLDLKKECYNKRPKRPLFKLCFDLVLPDTLVYPDGTTLIVENMEELKNAIKEWKENNPDSAERPHILFPIQVTTPDYDGVIDVADMDELKELLKDCIEKLKKKRKKGNKGGGKGGDKGGDKDGK